jgi:hypothetical protein
MPMFEDNILLHAQKRSRFNGVVHQVLVRESARSGTWVNIFLPG